MLREYRRRFDRARRELVQGAVIDQIDRIDNLLKKLAPVWEPDPESTIKVTHPSFEELRDAITQIDALLGSSIAKPERWGDLHRHLRFGTVGDLRDIACFDWPAGRSGLRTSIYGKSDPIPVDCDDLGALVNQKPSGLVATRLLWDNLSDEDFERVIFVLISSTDGYVNPAWLMPTRAPDRGRDLSVHRERIDSLSGSRREHVILQCKHWRSKSVSIPDLSTLKEQIKLWEPPRVDTLIITTSGRFTSDAVQWIERHNQSDSSLRIEMWPESHLELLLASRPDIIAEYGLR